MPNDSHHQPWKEYCENKTQKKRQLNGEVTGRNAQTQPRPKGKRPKTTGVSAIQSLAECFAGMCDPRVNRQRRHLLLDIIVIAICAVICNADTWKDIRTWGQTHQQWLGEMLELPGGIPSRDTFRRTISRIEPQAFQQAFLRWLSGLRDKHGKLISIDGKTLRGSKAGGNNPLHVVSAWASQGHVTLGQRQVDDKSNEITAIPQLLKTLQLQGSIVTIDAMGCQKEIAQQIVAGKGDYCLALKGNQTQLADDVAQHFETALGQDSNQVQQHQVADPKRPHGRQEERYYYTTAAPASLRNGKQWKGLKSIGMTITYGCGSPDKSANGDVRYYIMSFASDVTRFAEAVRSHWSIENSLHWVMDVSFREDESRIRKDHGGENVSWLRRLAITLIKNETELKDSIRSKRIRAGYDTDYLEKILAALPAPI